MSFSLFPGPFTGQTGATPPASRPPAWMALAAASSLIPISSGPTASPSIMPGAVCTGWTLSTTSLRGPIWMGVTARLSLARVRPFLHSPSSLVLLTLSQPPEAFGRGWDLYGCQAWAQGPAGQAMCRLRSSWTFPRPPAPLCHHGVWRQLVLDRLAHQEHQ